MPRESPFDIELTVDEHDILEETARASPYIDVVRAKIILYAAEGLTNKEIGERLDTPRQIVSKWRNVFSTNAWRAARAAPPARPVFPPPSSAVKALACELPHQTGLVTTDLRAIDSWRTSDRTHLTLVE